MSNELIPQNSTTAAIVPYDFDAVASGDDSFLSRLQLYGSKSDAVAESKIAMGHYGIVTDGDITDVGEDVDAIVVDWRAKALQIDGENIIDEHNPKSETYKQIKALSEVKDSGCMHGPEFLLWIPSQNRFVTYFMSSKTARRESRKVLPFLRKAVTLKCKLIVTAKYKWHGPVVIACSTPLDTPDPELLEKIIESFKNPPKSDVEVVPEDESTRVR